MYFANDKKSIIRDIQQFLLVIGQGGDIPHLSVDGIYSIETEEAVRAFQKLHLLEVTGKVDRETFDLIYSEYITILNPNILDAYEFDKGALPLKTGDSGNEVSTLNALIRELSRFYKDLPVPYGDFYSKNTENAIKRLQRYLRLSENGETSLEFFNTLRKEARERQKFTNA